MATINLKLGDIKEPLPKRMLARLCREAFRDANLYPANYDMLISRLAKIHDIKPENIVLVNGVDEGIELAAREFGSDILIFPPTYYEFLDAPRRNGLNCKAINCFDGKKYALKYSDAEVKNRSLIFLCNPNNPFGLLQKDEILRLAGETKGVVAVDETYIDFDGKTAINEFENAPNLLVIRSFSKGYSLAGLRIGYIIGEKSLIARITKRKLIANVTSVSVNAAMIALDEKKYFRTLIGKIKKRKIGFEEFLEKMGFNVIRTNTNNVVIKFRKADEAGRFNNFLEKNGIIANQGNGISTCGLDDSFIRFAYGTEQQMKKVSEIIGKYKL